MKCVPSPLFPATQYRKFRRTVFTSAEWKRHRSTLRYVKALTSISRSSLLRGLLNQVLLVSWITAALVFWNLYALSGVFTPFKLPVLRIPALPFRYCRLPCVMCLVPCTVLVSYTPCNARPPLESNPFPLHPTHRILLKTHYALHTLRTATLPSLTSPSLGLLLVFRTNAAYARWTEARALWSTVNARSWDLMRQVA